MSVVLSARNLSRIYPARRGSIAAVRQVSLEIQPGEFVAVCGRSGSGKSTLMALLGALARPDHGTLHFEGIDLLQLSPHKLAHLRSRRMGFMLQTNSLLPGLTALDNAALPGMLSGESQNKAYSRALALLTRLGMGERWDAFPHELSGGQQRRVSLARGLQHEPSLILLDEPTSNLDPLAEEEILKVLQELRDERKLAIFAVTHGDQLASLADRVFQMSAGELSLTAKPSAPAFPSSLIDRRGPVFEKPPQNLANQETPTPAPVGEWRGPASFFLATLIIGAALLFSADRIIAWSQGRHLWAKQEKKRITEEIAFRQLRADVESIEAMGDGNVRANLFLQNYDSSRGFFVLGPSLRIFYQADGHWDSVPQETPEGSEAKIREVVPAKTLIPFQFKLLPSKYDELIRGYFHIRITSNMVISETREAKGDLFERQDDYYIYLKDPRLTMEEIRRRNGWVAGSVVPPMDRHARPLIPLKSPLPIALFLVALAALVYGLTRPDSKAPAVLDEKISRRHPSPPSDLQTLNQSTGQNIAQSVLYRMDGQVAPWSSLPKEKPVVLVFFSHDCDCSLEFAKYFAVAMEKAKTKASWFFLFAGTPDQIHQFMTKTGTNLPVLRDPDSQLGQRLGITKSGCFILVQPNGLVSAIWPGTSLAGLNDLFSRLYLPTLSPDLPGLSEIPQAPTAGCPLQP